MTAWTLTTLPTRGPLATITHPDQAAARQALADQLAALDAPKLAEAVAEGATLAELGGTLYALAPHDQAEALAPDATAADQRAHVLALGLRTNGWRVSLKADDADGTRTVRLYAYRERGENGAALAFTSALAAPTRSRLARCYQSTPYDTLAMGTLRAVLAWCTAAARYRRPAYVPEAAPVEAPAAAEPLEAQAPAPLELVEAAPAQAAPVVLVACGAAKLDRPAPAAEMYTGSYHRATRRAAAALAGPHGRVMILSAEYGLLDLDTVITPYEKRLPERTAPAEWVAMVRSQAEAAGLDLAAVVVLAGRAYVAGARQVWADLVAPLEGTRGIGDQLRVLAEIYRPAEAAAALEPIAAAELVDAAPAEAVALELVAPDLGTPSGDGLAHGARGGARRERRGGTRPVRAPGLARAVRVSHLTSAMFADPSITGPVMCNVGDPTTPPEGTPTMSATTTPAAQYAIVVNGAAHGTPVPSNSAMVVVGPSADHNELRELLTHWFDRGAESRTPVPYHLRKVSAPADDLARTADNAVIYEDNGAYLAGWTPDAGYAAHPFAMFSDASFPESVDRELIATMYHTRRPGFSRGAWVIVSDVDGTELAAIGNKRQALARLREVVADHLTRAAVPTAA